MILKNLPVSGKGPAPARLTTRNARPYVCAASQACAQVAELVDALVSGTSGESRGGSSPLLGTRNLPPQCHQFAFAGATRCPGKPARSIACCTNPEDLACSINSLM